MAHLTPKPQTLAQSKSDKASNLFREIFLNLLQMLEVRRTQSDLRQLSERELDDIGITRDQIEDPTEWPPHQRVSRDRFRRW